LQWKFKNHDRGSTINAIAEFETELQHEQAAVHQLREEGAQGEYQKERWSE